MAPGHWKKYLRQGPMRARVGALGRRGAQERALDQCWGGTGSFLEEEGGDRLQKRSPGHAGRTGSSMMWWKYGEKARSLQWVGATSQRPGTLIPESPGELQGVWSLLKNGECPVLNGECLANGCSLERSRRCYSLGELSDPSCSNTVYQVTGAIF